MKNIIISLICVVFAVNLNAQDDSGKSSKKKEKVVLDKVNYRITYQLTWRSDLTKTLPEKEKMLLLVGDSTSLFMSRNQFERDSTLLAFDRTNASPDEISKMMYSLPRSAFKYFILKQKATQQLAFNERVGLTNLTYTERLNEMSWGITSETAQKSGYQCQKATTTFAGRDYEAWFTFEIPISNGPYKFGGLPGLILELHDIRNHYVFELVGFEKTSEGEIAIENKKRLAVSREKFDEVEISMKENPLQMFQNLPPGKSVKMMKDNGREATDKEFEDWMKSNRTNNDNPIELEY